MFWSLCLSFSTTSTVDMYFASPKPTISVNSVEVRTFRGHVSLNHLGLALPYGGSSDQTGRPVSALKLVSQDNHSKN